MAFILLYVVSSSVNSFTYADYHKYMYDSPDNFDSLVTHLNSIITNPTNSFLQIQIPLRILPSLLLLSNRIPEFIELTLAHRDIFNNFPLSSIPGFTAFYEKDPLWLSYELAMDLQNQIISSSSSSSSPLTAVDHTCVSSPSQEACCPRFSNSELSSNPTLATQFLSTLFDAHTKLGVFLDETGAFTYSLLHFQSAINLCGPNTGLELRIALATPTLYSTNLEASSAREKLLGSLTQSFDDSRIDHPYDSLELMWSGTPATFLVGYQGLEDSKALGKIAQSYIDRWGETLLQQQNQNQSHLEAGPPSNKKLNVGFASSFLADHSVGRLIAGVIESLDTEKFEISVFSCNDFYRESYYDEERDYPDKVKKIISSAATNIVLLPRDFTTAGNVIKSFQLDVLIYPELGMDSYTLFLSYQRLATTQLVFWGHPMSQGIPTIDYSITSNLFEQHTKLIQHNSQRIMLEGLTVKFTKPTTPHLSSRSDSKELFNFHLNNVYLVPQTLMKFHVDFDSVMVEILKADPKGLIVITYNENQILWKNKLLKRLENKLGRQEKGQAPSGRFKFLPSLEKTQFYHLLNAADCILDPFPWGGGVTALESFASGGVMVTLPKKQHVVTLAAGMYELMGFVPGDEESGGVVARSESEYIEAALKLAANGGANDFRQKVEQKISQNIDNLFDESRLRETMQDWETMLLSFRGSKQNE